MKELIQKLWQKYTELAPEALEIKQKIDKKEGRVIQNDHIALRTLEGPFGIDETAKAFLSHGYQKKNFYSFKEKRLNAYHFEHSNPEYPKIFISELRIEEFSNEAKEMIELMVKKISLTGLEGEDLILSGKHWDISYSVYQRLYKESEYLAWFYLFGFVVNHFTVFFNDIKTFQNLSDLNSWLESEGYQLNLSGGRIKGSKDDLLEQSSTMAQSRTIHFTDGDFKVPTCYYEFAKRYNNAEGNLFQGFVSASADKIFESTHKK